MGQGSNADRIDNPVLRVVGAILIAQSWISLVVVAVIFVAMIVLGTTLGQVIGAVLLVAVALLVWRGIRSA